jgi:hypothetical protein
VASFKRSLEICYTNLRRKRRKFYLDNWSRDRALNPVGCWLVMQSCIAKIPVSFFSDILYFCKINAVSARLICLLTVQCVMKCVKSIPRFQRTLCGDMSH